ncbi:hypothetical protein ACFQZ1_10360 [Bacillus sp. CGMCC 1.60114]|uniref:hypothetical protein n=1 Tax=unclassified Bacillus (in: firmicutes) TaxID=185979 RepID=UPI0036375A67
MQKIKPLILLLISSFLLFGCSDKQLSGKWRLVDNDKNCPISYEFKEKIEVNPKTKEKKKILLIDMYTQKLSDEYKYVGIYRYLDKNLILVDYGNSFTQQQKMVEDKDRLKVYFSGTDKIYTYTK